MMYQLIKNGNVIGYSNSMMNITDVECVEIPDDTYKEVSEHKKRIIELKELLFDTDYQAIKFAEGELTAEEYEPMRIQRKAWREEIRNLGG